MTLPVSVPYTFGNTTTQNSLPNLDTNFSTIYTAVNGIGNGSVTLSTPVITGALTLSTPLTAANGGTGVANTSLIPVTATGATTSTAFGDRFSQAYNVKSDFGALGTGTGDDSAAINAAQAALNLQGGGVLYFPPGVYNIKSLVVLYNNITWQGSGLKTTVIQADASLTTDMIVTNNFYSLTGTNSSLGVYKFALYDLGINGNKSARSSGGDCLVIYGYDYTLRNVEIYNAFEDGMYSEWGNVLGTTAASPSGDQMEARINFLKVFGCARNGLVFNGPHDTQINGMLAFSNGSYGAWFSKSANYTADATVLTMFHAYSNGAVGLQIDCAIVGTEIQSESNASHGIYVTSPNGSLAVSEVQTFNNTGHGIFYANADGKLGGVASWINTQDGLHVTGSKVTVTGIHTYNNGGHGVAFVSGSTGCILASVNSEYNTGDGVNDAGNSNTLSAIHSNNNTGNGITVTSSASGAILAAGRIEYNTGCGVSLAANEAQISGLIVNNNGANGLVLSTGLNGCQISAKCEVNIGIQAVLATLGAGNMIDLALYTTAGQTGWSGTIGNNFSRIGATGSSVVPYNSVQT